MVPIKGEQPLDDGRIQQEWYPWQVCTNCIAGRAKARCSHWYAAIQITMATTTIPLKVYTLQPGQSSEEDKAYGWFTKDVRDAFLGKDLGYYYPWECRDGVKRAESCGRQG